MLRQNHWHWLATFLVMLIVGCDSSSSRYATEEAFSKVEKAGAVADQEWRGYLNDDFAHASSLAEINTDNVSQLQLAWRYDASDAASNNSSQMQCNPLVVHGVLYCTSPKLNVFALNAATGEELWRYEPDFSESAYVPNANRGVTYWADESGDDRRILFTAGSTLFALDASTGRPVKQFGSGAGVDLRAGLPDWVEDASVVATTPGSVYKNLIILGSRVSEYTGAAPGHVRAFDVRSGELKWVFQTIPSAGEFGAETWPAVALASAGGANSWAGIAIDAERGMAFVPTGSPTFDFFGGDRIGDNLFGNSLVALNAKTGERLWYYQFVRHDLWDRDLPAPPNLIDWQYQGETVPAVAQVTKTGHVFVFHRETGEPLVPIVEHDVVGPAVSGDQAAATQPLPMFPSFTEQEFKPSTRTPEIAKAVAAKVAQLDPHAAFRPPSLKGTILYPGVDGGAEWGGAAYDAETNRLYVNANEVPYLLKMVELKGSTKSPEYGYMMLCAGCHGTDRQGDGVSVPSLVDLNDRMSVFDAWDVISNGRARMPGFKQMPAIARAAVIYHLWTAEDAAPQVNDRDVSAATTGELVNAGYQKLLDPENMPASEPPWGTLTAIDLDSASIAWRIPLGDYPQMLEQGVTGLGAENYGGPIITAGNLLFIAATPDKKLRAFDKRSGELLWSADLPHAGFATPSTYSVDGRQFVVVAAGGGKLGQDSGSEYLAFALPAQK